MAQAIEFAVRDFAGGVQHGFVAGDAQGNFIQVGSGDSVSLNLSRSSVVAYEQQGRDLIVKLSDGRSVVLSGYFDAAPGDTNHLYLSTEGEITEVVLSDTGEGILFADYGPAQGWGKWSPLDDLRFTQADGIGEAVVASNEPAGMAPFIPGLLGGFGGLGTAAAVAGGVAVIGGGGGGGGGRRPPTVDDPGSRTVTTNTADPALVVTGTGQPGDTVRVTIGTQVQTTTIGTGGTWSVTFPATGLPADGTHVTSAVFTQPNGTTTTLTGPTFVIDMTPPALAVTDGAASTGDVENLAEYADGVTLSGSGEPGATIVVQAGGVSQTTTVSDTGTWSVTFTQTQMAGGEREVAVTVTATDSHGNVTVVNDRIVLDTIPNPLAFNPVTADNVINQSEITQGIQIGGTSVAGATVTVTLQGQTQTATVGQNGQWTVSFPAGTLQPGEYDATATATTTDAAGNTTTSSHSFRVDTVNALSIGTVVTDDVVNAAENSAGVTLTGTTQTGSTVQVSWGGLTLPATVGADGGWTVTFPPNHFPTGEYPTTVAVTSTDGSGNTSTQTRGVAIDTTTFVTLGNPQMGDNVISGSERASGVSFTGTAQANADVTVTFEGATRVVKAGANGTWTASFTAAEVPAGTSLSSVSVTARDAAGNTATATQQIAIDTEVRDFAISTRSWGSDGINASEANAGVVLTGTVEPGSSVTVTFGNAAPKTVTAGENGVWSLNVTPGMIPAGEATVTISAVATDRYGNVSSTVSETVRVDRIVNELVRTGGAIAGDGIVNAAEAQAGVVFSGRVEPHSTVVISVAGGSSQTVTAGADGLWSATFQAGQLPQGNGIASSVTIQATDPFGNTSQISESFQVDTVAPGAPNVTSIFSEVPGGLFGIGTNTTGSDFTFYRVDASGAAREIEFEQGYSNIRKETQFEFGEAVPDGSYLVINTEDAAGNESSTLFITNTTSVSNVDLNRVGLEGFSLSAIDLTKAPDATLTITESQLRNLTGPDDTLLIKGDSNDTVNIVGGTDTNQSTVIGGQSYSIFTLGTGGATLLVDDDINTLI